MWLIVTSLDTLLNVPPENIFSLFLYPQPSRAEELRKRPTVETKSWTFNWTKLFLSFPFLFVEDHVHFFEGTARPDFQSLESFEEKL